MASPDVQFTVEDGIAFTVVNGVKATLNSIDGQTLIWHARQLKDGARYLETGSYLGGSALLVALHSNATVWAHDMWESQLSGTNTHDSLEVKDYLFEFYRAVKDNELQNRVIPIRGDSKYTVGIHDDKTIDLAFIDGDHSYDGAFGDLVKVFPKMKKGGTILAHDCIPDSEPRRAIENFTRPRGLSYQIVPGSWGMAVITV
jgi:predicted O-methyltransferase YrrM